MERKEYLFKDMAEIFYPSDAISDIGYIGKWRRVTYKHKDFEGVLLSTNSNETPDISFDPHLKGWYKIYLGVMIGSCMSVKLKSETSFLHYESSKNHKPLPGQYIEESLWREADMTNESIVISQSDLTILHRATIAHIKFVKITEDEIAFVKKERARKDTRTLYVSNDLHNMLFFNKLDKTEDFAPIITMNENSDTEWISVENVNYTINGDDTPDISYPRDGDRLVVENFKKFDMNEVYKYLVSLGHEKGFKMSLSLRMGAWGMGFPEENSLECDFGRLHPELRCVDRDGEEFFALSYAYSEVQDYMIDILLKTAESGCDAVTLIGHRGYPYVLFEKPVAERFYELYGEYPYELPLEEPRLRALHCEIMTEFVRKLRKALDDKFGKDKIEIHIRTLFSIEDSLQYALDIETWAKEKLITKIISYPMYHRNKLEGCFKDGIDDRINGRIDLEKYHEYVTTFGREATTHLDPDLWDLKSRNSPLVDCVISDEERIKEFNALEEKYGVHVYFDLMDRVYSNAQYKLRLLDLYEKGAKRIAYWDVNTRHSNNAMWNIAKMGGHKEELKSIDPNEGYKVYRVNKIGDYYMSLYAPMWGG